ncbi:MAG: cellulase family glycosylhydrolase [Candidatus Sumerlaeota bacterium]|nr:cellulase family glycosylhydrolase [Candidatus Sumerlaeota bacterium]
MLARLPTELRSILTVWGDEPKPLGLSVNAEGALEKDGKSFRGIGVNYFDCFYRTLKNPKDTSYEEGLRALAENKIPFIRMIGCGFWPVDCKLYLENKEEYFRRYDAVVKCAEKNGVGLIPSLFWTAATVPDLVGESCDQWGNPQSKAHEYMRNYTRDVVTRYRNSPAIWGWEFGNEYNLGANLPNAPQHRPAVHPTLGTAKSRSERDEWTYEMIRVAFAEFGKEVRRHDPRRIISTGDSILRPHAWHNWKEKSWKADTDEQFLEMLRGDNPDPISVISIHAYGENIPRIATAAQAAAKIKKPLFIGEFGVEGVASEKTEKEFAAALAAIEQSKAPLAAVWVYDHGDKDAFNVTAQNPRSYQLKAIAEANARIRAELNKTTTAR